MQSKAQTSIRSKPTLFLFRVLPLVFVVSLVVDMGALLIYLYPELFPELTFWAPANSGNSSGTVGGFNYVLFIFIIFGFFYPSGFGLVFLLIFIASVIMTWNWFRQVSESIRALDAGAVDFQGRAAGNDNAVNRSCLMKLTHALGDLWSKSLPKTLPDGAALEDGARAPKSGTSASPHFGFGAPFIAWESLFVVSLVGRLRTANDHGFGHTFRFRKFN